MFRYSGDYTSSNTLKSPLGSQRSTIFAAETITSMEIAEIYKEYKDKGVHLCNVPVSVVTIVGVVKSVAVQSTNITYTIDDMSDDPITVHQWLYESDAPTPLKEATYVRFFGKARKVKGELYVEAHNSYSLSDMNELTTHLLEVIHTKLVLKKRQNRMRNATVGHPMVGVNALRVNPKDALSPVLQSKVMSGVKSAADVKKEFHMLQNEGFVYSTERTLKHPFDIVAIK